MAKNAGRAGELARDTVLVVIRMSLGDKHVEDVELLEPESYTEGGYVFRVPRVMWDRYADAYNELLDAKQVFADRVAAWLASEEDDAGDAE